MSESSVSRTSCAVADGYSSGLSYRLPALEEDKPEQPEASSSSPSPPPQKDVIYAPYSDDPSPSPGRDADPHELLQEQRFLMDGTSHLLSWSVSLTYLVIVEQDAHLDRLSHSIGRQRDISLQINDELDVHTGLLEELDTDLDQTHNRLSGAAKRLQTFSRGVRGNCESPICTVSTFVTNYLCFSGSTYTIAALIFVLLILIIIFKT